MVTINGEAYPSQVRFIGDNNFIISINNLIYRNNINKSRKSNFV